MVRDLKYIMFQINKSCLVMHGANPEYVYFMESKSSEDQINVSEFDWMIKRGMKEVKVQNFTLTLIS